MARKPPCGHYGDIDNDGYVTENDTNLIMEYWNGNRTFTEEQKKRADVNGDGMIDIGDVTAVLNYVAGSINTFLVCKDWETTKQNWETIIIVIVIIAIILYILTRR